MVNYCICAKSTERSLIFTTKNDPKKKITGDVVWVVLVLIINKHFLKNSYLIKYFIMKTNISNMSDVYIVQETLPWMVRKYWSTYTMAYLCHNTECYPNLILCKFGFWQSMQKFSYIDFPETNCWWNVTHISHIR